MNASGKRIGGYETIEKRLPAKPAGKLRRGAQGSGKQAKAREALEAMCAAIRELLESQRLAYAGEKGMDDHAAAMRRVLRYVRRKVKRAGENAGAKPPPRRKHSRTRAEAGATAGKGCMRK